MTRPGVTAVTEWSRRHDALDALAEHVDTVIDRADARVLVMGRAAERAAGAWRGEVADAALAAADCVRQQANRVFLASQQVADAINRHHPDLRHACERVVAVVRDVTADGYRVADDGTVIAPVDMAGRRPRDVPVDASPAVAQRIAAANATIYQEAVQLALHVAGDADRTVALAVEAARTELMAIAGTTAPDSTTVSLPSCLPTEPGALSAMWSSLTVTQKAALAERDSQLGNRDGIPVADRDRINRQRLGSMRGLGSAGQVLRNTLSTAGRRLVSLHDDGRVTVAVGDPDSADHVATIVPGTFTELATIDDNVRRAEGLRAATTGQLPHGESVAVVVWQDYRAPSSVVGEASSVRWAQAAAPALDAYAQGLRVSHIGTDAHHTVIGHSYGTTVVGVAASGDRALAADDVVLLASPGLGGAGSVHDLHLAGVAGDTIGDHVWSSTARFDPIRVAAPYVLGPDPDGPFFGARHFPSAPGGYVWDAHSNYAAANHSAYFDENNPALAAMARIVAGRGG